MLDLILIDVQYKESIVSSIEKGFNDQNHPSLDCHHPIKQFPCKNFWKIQRYEIHPVSQQCSCG